MAKLIWDAVGAKEFELGVDHGVLYPATNEGYDVGVPWNGLVSVTESPEGAEPTDLYADNIKYGVLISAETLKLTIEHYATPVEFYPCDGLVVQDGVMITGQPRQSFGLVYRTKIGNDLTPESGYKLHLVYGCKAGVAEKGYNTINDSPEAIVFSREVSTLPVVLEDGRITAQLIIDSRTADAAGLAALEDLLFGTADSDPELIDPDEVLRMVLLQAIVAPATVSKETGNTPADTQQFTCKNKNNIDIPCTWSLEDGAKSSISSDGLLTIAADETVGDLTVTATPLDIHVAPETAVVTITAGT